VEAARVRLFELIKSTPHLDWLLLTKRPENFAKMLPSDWGSNGYANVWLGVSVENQTQANARIPILLGTAAAYRYLSCEPLVGPVLLPWEALTPMFAADDPRYYQPGGRGVDWVIVGGESGHGARPMHPDWARDLRDHCTSAGVAYLFKQWGEYAPISWREAAQAEKPKPSLTINRKGESVFTQVGHVCGFREADDVCMEKQGKGASGRLLDGRTWDEFPMLGGLHDHR
jgi:protein gp37